jgi:hypothetical protein
LQGLVPGRPQTSLRVPDAHLPRSASTANHPQPRANPDPGTTSGRLQHQKCVECMSGTGLEGRQCGATPVSKLLQVARTAGAGGRSRSDRNGTTYGGGRTRCPCASRRHRARMLGHRVRVRAREPSMFHRPQRFLPPRVAARSLTASTDARPPIRARPRHPSTRRLPLLRCSPRRPARRGSSARCRDRTVALSPNDAPT